ncbi:MAG: hypothetical protein APF76_03545 [Desulfitibacter sp. BRH_c19]|nr:MAG: hypothetical protein APF76_03545 [Desulfitibacter sp. BRH_c19]
MDRNLGSILAAVLITAIIIGGGVYWWQNSTWTDEVDRLNQEIVELRQQVEEGQVKDPPDEEPNESPDDQVPNDQVPTETEISRKPKAGWEQFFPAAEETTLLGKSISEIRETLGEPPVLVRSIAANPENSKEMWVYHPFDEDPTGLYLFFKGGELVNSRLDEFSGLSGIAFWDEEEFWQN